MLGAKTHFSLFKECTGFLFSFFFSSSSFIYFQKEPNCIFTDLFFWSINRNMGGRWGGGRSELKAQPTLLCASSRKLGFRLDNLTHLATKRPIQWSPYCTILKNLKYFVFLIGCAHVCCIYCTRAEVLTEAREGSRPPGGKDMSNGDTGNQTQIFQEGRTCF